MSGDKPGQPGKADSHDPGVEYEVRHVEEMPIAKQQAKSSSAPKLLKH
jgi:hypothetical protein